MLITQNFAFHEWNFSELKTLIMSRFKSQQFNYCLKNEFFFGRIMKYQVNQCEFWVYLIYRSGVTLKKTVYFFFLWFGFWPEDKRLGKYSPVMLCTGYLSLRSLSKSIFLRMPCGYFNLYKHFFWSRYALMIIFIY